MGGGETIGLRSAHVNQLAAARDHGRKQLLFFAWQASGIRLDRLAKAGQQTRIQLVGLGQQTGGFGKFTHTPRVD